MIDITFIIFAGILLFWSLFSLDLNQQPFLYVFSSFFCAMIASVSGLRVIVKMIEFLYFEAERDKALICSKRVRLHREWSRPEKFLNHSVRSVPVGKLRPTGFGIMPKTVLF